jgi:hypothetical protein
VTWPAGLLHGAAAHAPDRYGFRARRSVGVGTCRPERADPYQVATVCTSVPINIGRRIAVASGGELQLALDAAVSGDTILLAPGALFTPTAPESSFRLRNRPIAEGQWVVVRSAHAAFDADGEVAPHTRLEPSRADLSITYVTSLGTRGTFSKRTERTTVTLASYSLTTSSSGRPTVLAQAVTKE